jgi:hypothetical protein
MNKAMNAHRCSVSSGGGVGGGAIMQKDFQSEKKLPCCIVPPGQLYIIFATEDFRLIWANEKQPGMDKMPNRRVMGCSEQNEIVIGLQVIINRICYDGTPIEYFLKYHKASHNRTVIPSCIQINSKGDARFAPYPTGDGNPSIRRRISRNRLAA